MSLAFEPAWAIGLLLAMVRVGGFLTASPLTNALPVTGRLGLSLALGWTLAESIPAPTELPGLLAAAAVNLGLGVTLGLLTGLIIHLFEMAGSLVDLSAGLQTGLILDPLTGSSASVFGRAFRMTALTLYLLTGGLQLAIAGLARSVTAVGLDGHIVLDPDLARSLVSLATATIVAAIELALPAVAALFLAEVVLGLVARLAPQANVFLLGLPAKLGLAFITVTLVLAAFPATVSTGIGVMEDAMVATLRSLAG